ncbi:MAG: hypothetical protein QOD13_2326 [Thermoleophilaceae bacterium]|nr:hypothetical protein [Thermoleophilaceae bacterium]
MHLRRILAKSEKSLNRQAIQAQWAKTAVPRLDTRYAPS